MTLKISKNIENAALVVTGESALTDADLAALINALTSERPETGVVFALVDFSRIGRVGNVDRIVDFAAGLRRKGVDCALKVAFVLGPDMLSLSQIVLALQECGVWATDFDDAGDAQAWLFDEHARAPAWITDRRG